MEYNSVFINNEILNIINKSYLDEEIQKDLKLLKPFRKGPYQINGIFIPSQWNSFIKWKYFLPIYQNYLKNILVKKFLKDCIINVLDIGSNNGYYSFLFYYLLKKEGIKSKFYLIDPVEDFYKQFLFLKKYLPKEDQENFFFEKIGWQDIKIELKFHVIFCMGILYHHTDPFQLLKKLHFCLDTGGVLILETITIDINHYPLCLIPEKKYAGSSGIWFIPNKKAVLNLLKRINFREILFHNERFIIEEMVQNDYLPGLKEQLSDDKNSTIEGYPLPYRSFFTAVR